VLVINLVAERIVSGLLTSQGTEHESASGFVIMAVKV
jgi:hypothetical protein